MTVLAALTLLVAAAAAHAQQHKAITAASADRELAFTVSGRVAEVPVKAGQRVKAGDPLIILEDEEGEQLVELYRLRSESQVKVEAARAELAQKRTNLKRVEKLIADDAARQYELEMAQLDVTIGELALRDAEQTQMELDRQFDIYEIRHRQYTLRAPIDGVVDVVIPEVGESVEQLKSVLRLVDAVTLWVDTPVPTDQTLALKVGDPAWVRYNLPGQEKPVEGRIIHVAAVADSTSQDRVVRVELPNPQGLPAGVHVRVSFTPAGSEMAAADAKGARR